MGRLSPTEKKLNLIFFIGSGKPKTFRLPFIVIEIAGIFLLIGIITVIVLFYSNTQHRNNILKLEDQIVKLKKGIFYNQVTFNNILSQKYNQRKQSGFKTSKVSQVNQTAYSEPNEMVNSEMANSKVVNSDNIYTKKIKENNI